MTDELQRDDDLDPTDDFVIDEAPSAGPPSLDDLFDEPAGSAAVLGEAEVAGAPASGEDADDLLFAAPPAAAEPAREEFAALPGFAADAPSSWRGDGLDLGGEGVPDDRLEDAGGARDEFALEGGQELDLDDELEILEESAAGLGPATADAAGEAEEELVVLDEGGETWPAEAAGAGADEVDEPAEPAGSEVTDELTLSAVAPDAAEAEQAGWEPLAGAGLDELAEVHEVAAAGTVESEAVDEPSSGVSAAELSATIPAARPRPRLLAGRPAAGADKSRTPARLAAAAAVLLAAGIGVVALLEPKWFAGPAEPGSRLVAEVPRPSLALTIAAPPLPEPRTVAVESGGRQEALPPAEGRTPGGVEVASVPTDSVVPPQRTSDPIAVAEPAPRDPATSVTAPGTDLVGAPFPAVPEPVGAAPAAQPVASAPAAGAGGTQPELPWPVAVAVNQPGDRRGHLVRIGDEVLADESATAATGTPIDGVVPGTRAFAQLHNGNYFIGNVKNASRDAVTLLYGKGEITLPRADLARLTALGSQDYESLQKATAGFVRLTNRNRLVGSILAGITDDHVVLESRSNRVILPRSAVGEIVEGEGESSVRFGTTPEEEEWLQRQAARQLLPTAPARGQAGGKSHDGR